MPTAPAQEKADKYNLTLAYTELDKTGKEIATIADVKAYVFKTDPAKDATVKFYVKANTMKVEPVAGSYFTLDNVKWTVTKWQRLGNGSEYLVTCTKP